MNSARAFILQILNNNEESHHTFEDFAIEGSFQITAMEMHEGVITYARNIDHYQYRRLILKNTTWVETQRGPLIPRNDTDKLYMCIGLQTIKMDKGLDYLVVVSIRGRS